MDELLLKGPLFFKGCQDAGYSVGQTAIHGISCITIDNFATQNIQDHSVDKHDHSLGLDLRFFRDLIICLAIEYH